MKVHKQENICSLLSIRTRIGRFRPSLLEPLVFPLKVNFGGSTGTGLATAESLLRKPSAGFSKRSFSIHFELSKNGFLLEEWDFEKL